MKKFDVLNIPLQGNKLIEASAGTGKTYSIAVLVLRLLLEKNIRIEQILMVTFTNAAVAEMEIRIRQFLRLALNIVQNDTGTETGDPTILKLIDKAVKQKGKTETAKLLSNAILFSDESSIFTIHSFCQQILSEYAFETRQLFNVEITEDQSGIIEEAVNNYWRSNITISDIRILQILKEKGFSRNMLISFANEIFNGKKLKVHNHLNRDKILPAIISMQQDVEETQSNYLEYLKQNWELIKAVKIRKNSKLFKAIDNDDIETFQNILLSELAKPEIKLQAVYSFDFLFEQTQRLIEIQSDFDELKTDILVYFLDDARKHIVEEVELKKNRNRILSFHDLISKTHNAVMRSGDNGLHRELRKKYKAVFIDEFQDTDYLQYDIFNKLFFDNSILFFIGDPKQLIYSWRGADLNTYLKAKKDVGADIYTMTHNFRSTPALIDAMNDFFPNGRSCKTEEALEGPFCIKNIEYIRVFAGKEQYPQLSCPKGLDTAFDIVTNPANTTGEQYLRDAVYEVIMQLRDCTIDGNKVKPGDIGILVRTKKNAKRIKELLVPYNIPAIIVDDTKVIETEEATQLYYLLYAIQNLKTGDIARALLSPFTGFTTEEIKNSDFDKHKSIFLELKNIWQQSGIYSMIIKFIKEYGTSDLLLDGDIPNGKRIYANLMQLTEILNEKELYDNYSPEKLIDWFKKATEGLEEVNKYEQRLESDEEAVSISTIHKSKGLSYKIVILPDINMQTFYRNTGDSISYIDEEGFWISYNKTEEEIEKYLLNSDQENRRLLYVAITRAELKCIILYNEKQGALSSFIDNLPANTTSVNFRNAFENPDYYYEESSGTKDYNQALVFNKKINSEWRVVSFSALDTSKHNPTKNPEKSDIDDQYDRFVFETLPRGKQTGLVIHEIFEKLDFKNEASWDNTIVSIINKKTAAFSAIPIDNYKQMVANVLNTVLYPYDFDLASIPQDKRFNELEFFFSYKKFNTAKFKQLFGDIDILSTELSGIMHGFIDLIFEHDGKFYILDWKTNFLGYDKSEYNAEALSSAMRESNYHLQYLIYTIALIRFLKQKFDNFDYEKHFGGVFYLFVRGMRTGSNTGIFFVKPDKNRIDTLEEYLSIDNAVSIKS